MTFLTPTAALAALAAILPLAAVIVGEVRVAAVRRALGLRAPARRTGLRRPVLAAASIALLGLAASQPTLASTSSRHVRSDVEAMFVVDTSRSMAASATRTSPTRLDRARAAAVRLRASIPDVAAGVATLTDRVLPDLLPVPDSAGFDAVVERAVGIDRPPPSQTSPQVTTYGPLTSLATGNYFDSTATRRLVVLLTDGESDPFDTGTIARELSAREGYRLLAIRFWHGDESIYDADGRPETAYRPDPAGRAILASLAAAAGGRSFEEDQLGAASGYLHRVAGRGPTHRVPGSEPTRTALAPYVALVALLLFLASLWRRSHSVRLRRGRGRLHRASTAAVDVIARRSRRPRPA
ncbi:MAG TPA: VWA domain-containing protein [Gaiellaceae bacterium]|nr:VWA domain-containing protein [Gaiellaceae bacterium]